MSESKKSTATEATAALSALSIKHSGGRGNRNQNSGQYVPDPEKIAAMAKRIADKAIEDPTRLVGESIEEMLGLDS